MVIEVLIGFLGSPKLREMPLKGFMEKIWLPPLEVCCNGAKLELVVASNETVGMKTICHTHKKHFIKSPFASSRKNIKIRFSKKLNKMIGIKKPKKKASSEPATISLV